jgi:putative ATP-dependent endonuclease of the OLD family
MLCQTNYKSNILLDRKVVRKKLMCTEVVDLSEDDWMHPFSEILGLDNTEFEAWRRVLDQDGDFVFLVEGMSDKEYIEHINSLGLDGFTVPEELDIVPYDGKDALNSSFGVRFCTIFLVEGSPQLDFRRNLPASDLFGLVTHSRFLLSLSK